MSNTTTLVLKVESASSSLVARYSTILALTALVEAGLVTKSYLTRYINKNTSHACAIAHVRKFAKYGCKVVASNGTVNRYEVYLQFEVDAHVEDDGLCYETNEDGLVLVNGSYECFEADVLLWMVDNGYATQKNLEYAFPNEDTINSDYITELVNTFFASTPFEATSRYDRDSDDASIIYEMSHPQAIINEAKRSLFAKPVKFDMDEEVAIMANDDCDTWDLEREDNKFGWTE